MSTSNTLSIPVPVRSLNSLLVVAPISRAVGAIIVALPLLTAACGDGAGNSTGTVTDDNRNGITATGPGVLSVSPLDTSTLIATTPLGALAPPGHVLPTDHVYMYFVDPWSGQQQNNDCSARAVRAAGSGVVTFVLVTEVGRTDTKVDVQMTKTFHYYYDHVVLRPGIGVGTHVSAGDTIAYTTGRCPSMDLGVTDSDVSPSGFVNPSRYEGSTGHAASPYKYFAEPLRSWLYAHVRVYEGVPANKDGRIDYGVRGKLVGDWFHSSIASSTSSTTMGPDGWPKTISFAYDWFDNKPRISVGGTITDAGVLRISATDPDPASVSTANGLVAYQTTSTLGRIVSGWMLVQMISDERIRVEYFAAATSRPGAFTVAAQEYVR
ncbi:MAG: hypothetical protein ABI852_01240 [Gemmatimonadaceae bacterium]